MARGILALGVFLTPILNSSVSGMVVVISCGVLLAYDGLTTERIMGSFIFLLGMELVWGIDLGTWSLAYLIAALALLLTSRFITFMPRSYHEQWLWSLFARVVISGFFLSVLIGFVSVLISAGYAGEPLSVVVQIWATHLIHQIPIMIVLVVVAVAILQRIDAPFHRRIEFGIS